MERILLPVAAALAAASALCLLLALAIPHMPGWMVERLADRMFPVPLDKR